MRHTERLTLEGAGERLRHAYVWRLVERRRAGLRGAAAQVLYGLEGRAAAVEALCAGLVERQMIAPSGESFIVSPASCNGC